MTITGNQDPAVLLQNLSPDALLRLARDILVSRGHRIARVTDGPGDGGRDIHTLSADGEKHLSQCKYHKDVLQACTSQELAELPMAMVKLGYEHGTFVTNARISPQGKREFLDNYAGLSLEFLDGSLVATEVMANALLKAAWFDGTSISRINTQLVLPVIVRRHEDDLPINPLAYFSVPDTKPLIADLEGRFPGIAISVRRATASTEDFRRYRAPLVPTIDEAMPGVAVAELVFAGPMPLGDLEFVEEEACRCVLGWLGLRMTGLTVVVGKSYLVPTSGESAGARTLTAAEGLSFIQTKHSTDLDSRWFDWQRTGWTNTTDARVTEAEWIRLSNPQLNVCLAYEIETQAVGGFKSSIDITRSNARRGWARSVFALVPAVTELAPSVPVPDDSIVWKWDGRLLCGWFHWSLLGVPIVMPPQLNEEGSPFAGPSEESEDLRLGAIRKGLVVLPGVDLVDSEQARHMIALVGNDPFREYDEVRYRTAEVSEYPEDLPRPLIPQSRRFRLSIAWKGSLVGPEVFDGVFPWNKPPTVAGVSGVASWKQESPYVVVTIELSHTRIAELPTRLLIEDFEKAIEQWCASVEKASHASRATLEYWKQRFGVELGRGWKETGKTYVWRRQEDGSVKPVTSEEFLGDGFEDE